MDQTKVLPTELSCSTCGARPHQPCRTTYGMTMVYVHRSRKARAKYRNQWRKRMRSIKP